MFEFQIQFDEPLREVICRDAIVTNHVLVDTPPAENFDAQAYETLQAIDQKILGFQNTLRSELANIQDSTVRLAIEIANKVLQDEDLVAKRVTFVTESALSLSDESQPRRVFVNPSCESTISSWLSKSGSSLQVETDENLLPGDCRIEQGETGVLASLENYLAAAYAEINSREPKQGSADA